MMMRLICRRLSSFLDSMLVEVRNSRNMEYRRSPFRASVFRTTDVDLIVYDSDGSQDSGSFIYTRLLRCSVEKL